MTLTFAFFWLLPIAIAAAAAASPLFYTAGDYECQISIVESIPDNLTFNSSVQNLDTYSAYQLLIKEATREINFGSFYWSLRGTDVMLDPGDLGIKGETLLKGLIDKSQTVPVKIAYNIGGFVANMSDIELLSQQPNIQMVAVNISGMLGGVLHTKVVVADGLHAYIGSSNIDWRSLTQVKELGLLLTNCPTLVSEINKTFGVYWLVGSQNRIPNPWPASLAASTNATNPLKAAIGGYNYSIYFGASPPALCPPNWSTDLDAIINAILSAKKFVHIAVMEYEAFVINFDRKVFWGQIDNALRTVAFRRVRVRMLVSHWAHSDSWMERFVNSLTALNNSISNIEAKYFMVPAFTPEQMNIPFSRVNHNKYMVTDSTAVICTSNWSGSYFTQTAGLAISIKQVGHDENLKNLDPNAPSSIVEQVQAVFDRDWNSSYAHRSPNSTDAGAGVNRHQFEKKPARSTEQGFRVSTGSGIL